MCWAKLCSILLDRPAFHRPANWSNLDTFVYKHRLLFQITRLTLLCLAKAMARAMAMAKANAMAMAKARIDKMITYN